MKKTTPYFWFFLLSLLVRIDQARAFPEMVRHGYNNCAVCHYSPNGGGLINEYGRQLSREVLSTWGKDGEEQFLYGLAKPPEWLGVGGDFRFVYTDRDTGAGNIDQVILMQKDVEAAIAYKKMIVEATVGHQSENSRYAIESGLVSRRHYIGVRPTDEITVRGGKFQREFGINLPEHTVATRRGLGFDENSETYNLEMSYLGQNWNFFATGVFGRPDATTPVLPEKGAASSLSYMFAEKYKVGGSYYHGTSSRGSRHLFGPWVILGFTPQLYLLAEFDFQQAVAPSDVFGTVDYVRLGYEVVQGVQFFVTQEHQMLDRSKIATYVGAYGAGVNWYPRPHFDIQPYLQFYNTAGKPGEFNAWYWLMFHYYL